ncbi:hypothetical protein AAVH_35672, partial [Aphelenchoides avenae]
MDTTTTAYTTYPDYRQGLFPELENHAKEDPRPATGRRPQGMFGGGTNEYKEDFGSLRYGINDQRRPWEFMHNLREQPGKRWEVEANAGQARSIRLD